MVYYEPLLQWRDNDEHNKAARKERRKVVIASGLFAWFYVPIKVEMRKANSNQVNAHNDLICEQWLDQQCQNSERSDVKLTQRETFETLLVVKPDEDVDDIYV